MAFHPPRKAQNPLQIAPEVLAALALFTALFAMFIHLGDFPLLSPDEGRNAEVAREMAESGNWLVPLYNGATYLDKPAFFFRSVGLALTWFGNTEWAARLPSAVSGLLLLGLVYAFCRRVYSPNVAAFAVAVVATTPLFLAFSHIVIFDMMLGLFVSASLFAAYLAEQTENSEKNRSHWLMAAAAFGSLATLVKGPVGFLIPLLVMLAFHGSLGRTDAIKRLFRPVHWLIFLALVLPWFAGLSLTCPDFPYYGIVKESLSRFTTTEFRRTQPFYFYALIIASCFFAWSLTLPESIAATWRNRRRLTKPDRFLIIWAVVVVVFFSISKSKLPGYILTGVVALGILTARVFATALISSEESVANRIVRHGTIALIVTLLSILLLLTAIVLQPEQLKNMVSERTFAMLPGYVDILPMLSISLAGIALLAGAALFLERVELQFVAFMSLPILLMTVNFDLVEKIATNRSNRELALNIAARLPPDAEVACYECLPSGLPFYLGRPITVFSQDGRELTSNYVLFSLGSGKPWPERIVPSKEAGKWLKKQDHPVLLIGKHHQKEELDALAGAETKSTVELNRDFRGVLLNSNPLPGG